MSGQCSAWHFHKQAYVFYRTFLLAPQLKCMMLAKYVIDILSLNDNFVNLYSIHFKKHKQNF